MAAGTGGGRSEGRKQRQIWRSKCGCSCRMEKWKLAEGRDGGKRETGRNYTFTRFLCASRFPLMHPLLSFTRPFDFSN
jgi:hypothetical protein